MKKIVFGCLLITCLIAYSTFVPAIKIDGVPYKMDEINNGVNLLRMERDLFYSELIKSKEKEIQAFLSDKYFLDGYNSELDPLQNRLTGIIQRKIDDAKRQDAVIQARFLDLLNESRLPFSIPLIQVKRNTNYDDFYASLFPIQLKIVKLNGTEYDEAALTQIYDYSETYRKKLITTALREIEQKQDTINKKMLENLYEQIPLDEGIDINILVSIPANYYITASRIKAYSASLASQCMIPEQDKSFMLPVNFAVEKHIQEQFARENDFDKLFITSFLNFHEKMRLGFNDYYRSGFNEIVSGQIEQMKKNLTEQKNIDREFDVLQTARFNSYINKQTKLYEKIADSILERSLENPETAVSIPVIYTAHEKPAMYELSPLGQSYVTVSNKKYLETPFRMMEHEFESYTEFFLSHKKMTLEQETEKVTARQISNINENKDLDAGINTAGLISFIKYYSDQASKTEFFIKLFEQFKVDDSFNSIVPIQADYISEPKENQFDAYRSVINVRLPYVDAEDYNGLILDRDAARLINSGIGGVRSEWSRVNKERNMNMVLNRQNIYQQNMKNRRNVMFGINNAEIKESIAWEKRQREISSYFFPSLIRSCSLNAKAPEIAEINPDSGIIDISPLELNAIIIDGKAFDSDLAGSVENMAEILPRVMIETFNYEIRHTINREMDILRKNGADWAKFRYEIGTRLGLTMADLAELGKSIWAKIRSKEYQKKNIEADMYCYYMLRDFNLEEKLVRDLYWTQKTQEDLYTALISDFIDCSMGDYNNYLITGTAGADKIINANKTAVEYIADVFQSLLNTKTNIKFEEIDSMEELWGPVIILEIGLGFIPGVGLVADILIDVCIDIAACLAEKGLKKEEYAAKISEIVTIEEQKLLQIINRYDGGKK